MEINYTAIGKKYLNTRKKYREELFKNAEIVSTFIQSFTAQLDLPDKKLIKVFPPGFDEEEPFESTKSFSPQGCLKLFEDEKWHFDFMLKIHPDGALNSGPSEILVFHCITRVDGKKKYLEIVSVTEEVELESELKFQSEKLTFIGNKIFDTIFKLYDSRMDFYEGKPSLIDVTAELDKIHVQV